MPVRRREAGRIDRRPGGGWPFGLTALVGTLAGAILFPRPAQGGTAERPGDADLKK